MFEHERMRTGRRVFGRRFPIGVRLAIVLSVLAAAAWTVMDQRWMTVPDTAIGVSWQEHAEALRLSESTGKPILYEFTVKWCPPCQDMEHEVFADAQAAAMINRNFVPVKVVDRIQEEGRNPSWISNLQSRWAIEGFPTLVVVPSGGGQVLVAVGYAGKIATVGFLQRAFKPVRK